MGGVGVAMTTVGVHYLETPATKHERISGSQ